MFVSVVILTVFSLIGLIKHFNSKLFWGFFGCLAGIFIMLSASILYTIKLSSYPYFNTLDHYFYYIFMNISIQIGTVARIYNIGMAVIMLCMTFITHLASSRKRLIVPASIISVIIFLIVTDPLFTENLFFAINGSPVEYAAFYKNLENLCYSYCRMLFLLQLALPVIIISFDFAKSKIFINRRRLMTTIATQLAIDGYLVYYFVFSGYALFAPWNVDLFKFPLNLPVAYSVSSVIQSIILMFVVIFFLSLFFNAFDYFKITTKNGYEKNSRELNHNLRMLLHSEKNILVTVEKLAEQAIDLKETHPQIVSTNLNDIRSIASNGLKHLSKTIDMINDVSEQISDTNLIDCIESALHSLDFTGIHIERRFAFDCIIVHINRVHLTECFVNIFQNSIEAIHAKQIENGAISVTVDIENPYVYIQITDNGCGIPKNKIKNIFSPLVSSKQSAKNWGVGLNYVKNVVNLYHGEIEVKSAVGVYTTFQITFPFKN